MHNLDIAGVNEDKKMSDETLKRLDVMLSNNDIDFYIVWVIKIEERIERIRTKDWVTKKTKMHCNALKEKLKTIKENVDDLVRSRIKCLYTRKGVCKKDTIINLTKKYKVSGNERPAYREWEDDENDDTGSKRNSKLTTIAYEANLIKKKLLTSSGEN